LLPLRKSASIVTRPDQQPVLFALPADHFASLATELLRLGNDRQSFRTAKDVDGNDHVLLRVVGPPYYSLLRALENGDASTTTAFVECAPHVWVEFGYRHPLGEHFKPSAGKVLLMSPPRRWTFLDEAPFKDIYEVLDFALPESRAVWRESELTERLTVPLRLTPGGGNEPAELWVLRDDGIGQLDDLVQTADDALLARLSFAVGTRGDDLIIVLRKRPSKQPPPVVVLNAVAYRPYLKLPNLFLPCGTRLHPPLRRDAVRSRLADDPALVTWLQPAGNYAFTPESLPDTAFRPLSEWVEYILERERRPLEQWVQSTVFDFEPFICDEEVPPKPAKPPTQDPRRVNPSKVRHTVASPARAQPRSTEATDKPAENKPVTFSETAEPTELRKRLDALESQFNAVPGPLDAPEKQALWPELAELNTALGHDDAAVCWLHALWGPDGRNHRWSDRWLHTETELARKLGNSRTVLNRAPAILTAKSDAGELDRLLSTADPITAELRSLAAYLLGSAQRGAPSAALLERLNSGRTFLEQHDHVLPLRAAWTAWNSLAVLAGNDVLTLARARDRMLERLYENGLRPEEELPAFLRYDGRGEAHRFRSICPWLLELRESAGECCKRMDDGRIVKTDRGRTPACLDLILAFGLARLGEMEAAGRLQERAGKQLNDGEEFHRFLFAAYSFRIRQARTGKPRLGPLPDELLEYLNIKDTSRRMPFDRLRQTSRIIEPNIHVRWDRDVLAGADALSKALNRLPRLLDRNELTAECRKLIHDHTDELADHVRVLESVLEQAPRLGEEFARDLLRRVLPTYDSIPAENAGRGSGVRAELLEKALMVAAHFDNAAMLQDLVSRFQQLLSVALGEQSFHIPVSLAGQCLRGLRRLGMRQGTELLLRQLEDLLLQGKNPADLTAADFSGRPDLLSALLHLASGWYYFGREDQAGTVVNVARGVLFSGPLPRGTSPTPRAELASTYASVLGHAPAEFARQHWDELFRKLESVATSWHTTPGYCALQMKVVESVILAVVSEDFTQGAELRRLLDDEEYLIRKRIHEDLRRMMGV
jgi:hypothetical protein